MSGNILDRFRSLHVWKRNGKRAPHKPLLVLWALGKVQNGNFGPWSFDEIYNGLIPLLREFAPSSKVLRPEHPFRHLENDKVWAFNHELPKEPRVLSAAFFRRNKYEGSFSADVEQALKANPKLAEEIISIMMDAHFPESYFPDIAESCSIKKYTVQRIYRNPLFRKKVLQLYDYQCAVCKYQVNHRDAPVGLEAAHIKWHKAGGPDLESNGLALCSLHHALFDRGCFYVDHDFVVHTSPFITGNTAVEHLEKYNGSPLSMLPSTPEFYPENEYLDWHVNETFKRYGGN